MKKELKKYNKQKDVSRQISESHYPKQQLLWKQALRRAITVFGISVGILTFAASTSLNATVPCQEPDGLAMATDSLIEHQKGKEKNTSFNEQEKLPEFPGGQKALLEYLQKNIRHSEIDSLANSKYTYVQFTVDHDGQVIKPSINHKIHPLVDAEILRLISSLPRWEPGRLADKTVPVRYNLCFSFSQTYGMEVSMNYTCILYPNVYDLVHVMPQFPGGQGELMRFLTSHIKSPSGIDNGIGGGRTIVQFIVDKEGNILKPRIVRSLAPYLDKEALRVVNLMPKWKPGELEDGTKVAVRFTIPVMFRLQ